MAKKFVLVLGVVFLAIGVLGFVPALTSNDRLLGLFEVDTAHNVVHLASGVVAVLAALAGNNYARLYAQIFGVVYGLVAILGFLGGSGTEVLGFIPVNTDDNYLHLVIALASLYVGFAPESGRARA